MIGGNGIRFLEPREMTLFIEYPEAERERLDFGDLSS
jgi:hypothetical protein